MTFKLEPAAAAAAKSFLNGTMTPAEGLVLHLAIGSRMQMKHVAEGGQFFRLASNAAWPGGLAETITALMFSPSDGFNWKPNYTDYFKAVRSKTAGQCGEDLRVFSAWDQTRGKKARGHGTISDVDLFVHRDGLDIGFWRHFCTTLPETFKQLLDSPFKAFGCQVKMRMDWLEAPDDGHDALQWSYFVEAGTYNLEGFLAEPKWLPHPVDLFLVVKIDAADGTVNARARLLDRLAIQQQILNSVRRRFENGVETLAFGSQKFSFGDCVAFPPGTGANVSEPFTHLLRMEVPLP
ncbi:hypothetical protein [Arthrobacter sp. lap29]|uniref:hypothetical protein n=1 Tax=Arthrobacter sp. lap29 TaxID=3056122 RepID=UPI0028F6E745|nr:hypothetical protein [Arthrobacter sp. lap29]